MGSLGPRADIDAHGVTFTSELLAELLKAFHNQRGEPRIGSADFRGATFTGDAAFGFASFGGSARFDGATFDQNADLRGVTITGDALFGRATFSGDAFFSHATFKRDADFRGATFAEGARFDAVTFTRNALFTGATFARRADFGQAILTHNVDFHEATFTSDAEFGFATFGGRAWFNDATFIQDAHFENAGFADPAFIGTTFTRNAFFHAATFSGAALFLRATFAGDADFSAATIAQDAVFDASVVRGELAVEAVARRLSVVRLRGEGRLSLRLRATEVDLSDAVLAGPVSVHGLQHPIANVDEAAFADEAGQVPPVRVVSLRGLDALSVTLTDVDLSVCRFAGLQRVDQVVLDGRCVFADGPGGRRRVLAEEHHWRATQAAQSGGRRQGSGGWVRLPDREGQSTEVVGPERLEVLYRQLRKALEDAKNEPGAADFYYGEMEMRRAATIRRTERWLLGLYWVISGYGLRARRALAWLALLAVISIAGMTWFGFPHTAKDQIATGTVTTPAGRQPINLTIRQSDPVGPFPDRLEKATEVTVNAVIFRNPDADLTTAGRYLNIVARILGPILLGLTILAVRNLVKR